MPEAIECVAIVGPGLIGTSVALAARRRWPAVRINTIDKGDAISGVGDASVVVLSAPVDGILAAIPQLPGVLSPSSLVIDTGSTKRDVIAAARQAKLANFVGGHPMAGGTSLADARADLFDGRPWFLANSESPDAVARASAFVAALGATPVVFADHGEEHDRLMAAVSHLPQVAASMLMTIVSRAVGIDHLQWAGSGLRDTTRLAASDAAMWQSVLASNSREVGPLLKQLAAELAAFADALEDPEAVRRLFDEAKRARSALR